MTKTKNAVTNTPQKAEIEAATEPDTEYAAEILARLGEFKVCTQPQADKLGELLTESKRRYKELEAQRTSATKPLLEAKRNVDSWFKPATSALKKVETLLKGKLAAFMVEQERAKAAALEAGDHDTAMALAEPEAPSNMSARTVWTWEVVDIDQVPDDYIVKTVNKAKVDAMLKATGGQGKVSGLKITESRSLTVRT
jgi:hypothetical protein